MKSDPDRLTRHTDTFQAGVFRPHGSMEMWIESGPGGGTIYSVAQGPFNAEFLSAFLRARNDLMAKAGQQRLRAHILQMQRSMMASPDMLDEYRRLLGGLISGGMVAEITAWVVGPDVEGREFMLPLYTQVYRELNLPFASFESVADAEAWVREQLREEASPVG